MNIDETLLIVLAPIVTIAVQVLKTVTALGEKPKWIPVVAVISGVVLAALWLLWQPPVDLTSSQAIGYGGLHGILAGLAASGLYKIGSNSLQGILKRIRGL